MRANPHRHLPLSKKARPSVPDMRGRKVTATLKRDLHTGLFDCSELRRTLGAEESAQKVRVTGETLNLIRKQLDGRGGKEIRIEEFLYKWGHFSIRISWTEPTRRLSPKNLEYLRSRGVRLPCPTTPKT